MKTFGCLLAFCGLVLVSQARRQNWYTTGDFYERITSHLQDDGPLSLSAADGICQSEGRVLPTVADQEQLGQLMTELTELYWNGTRLKDCFEVNDVIVWLNHKVNVQGDTPPLLFKDIDDANGQYCAVLATIKGFAADLQGTFKLQGRDCASLQDFVCVRTGMFREVTLGSDEGPNQLLGNQAAVETMCQDLGMELVEINADSDEDDLEAEINRLGFPRYLKEDLRALNLGTSYAFHTKNKVGGNHGDVVTFSGLTAGSNCLIVKNRPEPDIELYDLVVDDCTTVGRGLCEIPTAQGRFFNKLTIVDEGEIFKRPGAAAKCASIGKELVSLYNMQDVYEISRELVRMGVFNFVTTKNFRNGFWMKNSTTLGGQEITFSDIIPEDPALYCLAIQNSEVAGGEHYKLRAAGCEGNWSFQALCEDAA